MEKYEYTRELINNLFMHNFEAVFARYESIEIALDVEDEIREFISYAGGNQMPFAVFFGERALCILHSEEFVRADIDRSFSDSDEPA